MAQRDKPSYEEHMRRLENGEVERRLPPLAPVWSKPGGDPYAVIGGQVRTGFVLLRLDGDVPTWEFRDGPLKGLGSKLKGIGGLLVSLVTGTGPLSVLLDTKLPSRVAEIRSIVAAGAAGASIEELGVRIATVYEQDDLLETYGRIKQLVADYLEAKTDDGEVDESEWASILLRHGLV